MNDAAIMSAILAGKPEIQNRLQPNDVFVLDRGFRDCAKALKTLNYVVQMPKFTDSKEPMAQLTTSQGNASRLVTKTRWVVESRNGHLKTIWPIFDAIWKPRELMHLKDDIRIGAALINKYRKTLVADKKNEAEVANKMLERANVPNSLRTLVQTKAFEKAKKKLPMVDVADYDFPTLSVEDMKMVSLGSYQLDNARPYSINHMKLHASYYECFYCPPDVIETFFRKLIDQRNISKPIIVMTQFDSRHRSGIKYDSYILVDGNKNGAAAIDSYTCECKSGLRTVGCCSHVMATIYYLSHMRHQGGPRPVAPYLDNLFANQ